MNVYLLIDFDAFFHNGTDGGDMIHDDKYIIPNLCQKDPGDKKLIRFMQEKDCLIKLGNGDVPQGLELAIRYLSLGECAIVHCHSKFAHPHGRKNKFNGVESNDLPSSKDVIYRVYLRSIKSIAEDQSYTFRLKLARQLKSIGNDYYINEWIGPHGGLGKVKSLKAYNGSSNELVSLLKDLNEDETSESGENGELRGEAGALLVDCLNNISAAHLRDQDYGKAKDAAAEAIKLDPNNIKALCRAAKAAMSVGEFEESKMALEIAIGVDKANVDVQKLNSEYDRKLKLYRKKEREMYAKMMNSDVVNKSGVNESQSLSPSSKAGLEKNCKGAEPLSTIIGMDLEEQTSFKYKDNAPDNWKGCFLISALLLVCFVLALNHILGGEVQTEKSFKAAPRSNEL